MPISNSIETTLFRTARRDLTENDVKDIVQKSIKPYADAWQFYKELVAVFEAAGGMKTLDKASVKKIRQTCKEFKN